MSCSSNSIRPEDVAELRRIGCVSNDPYPVVHEPKASTDTLITGAKVFRRQCAVCHTIEGSNAVSHLTATWDPEQLRMNLAKLQQTKPFMPPFAGTPTELECLVQYILWVNAGRPAEWTHQPNEDHLQKIERWLAEAGTEAAQ